MGRGWRRDAVIDLKEGRSPVYEEQSNVEIITAKGHPTPPQNRGNPGSSPSIDLYGRPVSPNYWSEHLDEGKRKEDCGISTYVRACVCEGITPAPARPFDSANGRPQ